MEEKIDRADRTLANASRLRFPTASDLVEDANRTAPAQ
jgi:hypothetical protein